MRSLPSPSRRPATRGNVYLTLSPSNLRHPFTIREGTSDAIETFYTIVRQSYGRYLPQNAPEFILDAGANIGSTAAWFLSRYPSARLIAVEPDPSNFNLLKDNCARYMDRAELVQGAVWPTPARLSFAPEGPHNAVCVLESPDGPLTGVTIPSLMKRAGFPRLDLFKCDIEGTEEPLFAIDADDWLGRTRFIVVETHGSRCRDAVIEATSRHGFSYRCHRDLHIFFRPGAADNSASNVGSAR